MTTRNLYMLANHTRTNVLNTKSILSNKSTTSSLLSLSSTSSTTLSSSLFAPLAPTYTSIGSVRWDSTKRKRAKKMNRHKYQKMKKRMRNLTAKNIKGNNA